MNKLNVDFLNLFIIVFSVISILILMILVIHSIYDNRLTKNKIRKINKIDKLNIEDIERLDVNELEKYKYEIRYVYLFNKRKKIIIKRKIDKYIKDNNLILSNLDYEDSIKWERLVLKDKIVEFSYTVKEILLLKVKTL